MAKSHQTSSATVDGCEIKMADADADAAAASAADAAATICITEKVMTKPKNRKKREELSSSATKSIKKEFVDIVITFD